MLASILKIIYKKIIYVYFNNLNNSLTSHLYIIHIFNSFIKHFHTPRFINIFVLHEFNVNLRHIHNPELMTFYMCNRLSFNY